MPADPGLQGAHVELRDIGKSFGAARALEAVSLQIARGSIHALVGENGAGKSTLGKIVSGVIPPDRGEMLLGGEPVRFHSPREAIARGIVLIAQELSLVPALSVAENVFLGTEPRRAGFLRKAALRRRYAELAGSVGFELDGDAARWPAADRRPAEGRDPAGAVPRRRADRDGRADGGPVPPRCGQAARDHPPARRIRHDDRPGLAFPARGARPGAGGDDPARRPRRPHGASGGRDRGVHAERDARAVPGCHVPRQAGGRGRGTGGALGHRPQRGRGERRLARGAGRRDRRPGRPGRRRPAPSSPARCSGPARSRREASASPAAAGSPPARAAPSMPGSR